MGAVGRHWIRHGVVVETYPKLLYRVDLGGCFDILRAMAGLGKRRTAAILEVLGVYLAGGLVTDALVRISGVAVVNPFANLSADISNADLLTAARQLLLVLTVQYLGWFLLIVPMNWWYRRRGRRAYGLTRAGRPWVTLVLLGLGTAALCEWLVLGVGLANAMHPTETVGWRVAFYAMSWKRWQFWVFSGVGSWAMIPVLEELFFRGYCQRRLAEDWGDGPAIVGTACLFTFAHAQYQIANLYNVGMVVGLLMSAVGFGLVFAWTRSLVPAIVAHAVFDIPMTPRWQGVVVGAMVIAALLTWRRGRDVARGVFAGGSAVGYGMLAVVCTAYAVAASRVEVLEYVAVGMVVVAVGIEAVERRLRGFRSDGGC